MNKNILIVLGGAIMAAILVALLVQVTLGGKKSPDSPKEMAEILVAADDLKIGRELVEGDLRWQEWPKETLFKGAIVREEEQKAEEALKGRLGRNLSKDEPVMQNAILKETKGNFVAASLKEGERAMAIKVDPESMVAGFISPGDYVDVILTYRQDIKSQTDDPRFEVLVDLNLEEYATETVLENIRVLAVDQMAERDEDDEKIKVGKTVTLAVQPRDGEKLALASKMGTVVLALRGVGDQKVTDIKEPTITDARMTKIRNEIYKQYWELRKEKGVRVNTLKIYQGENMQVIPVKE